MLGTDASVTTLLTTVGLPNRPSMRRQRRLVAHDALLAFQALEHGGFFAADIGAGAEMQFDVEVETAALDVLAEPTAVARRVQRARQDRVCQRVFGTQVDIALARADRESGDGHGLDQAKRIAFHQHAVRERAAVAFVGVAGNVLLLACRVGDRAPLDASWKTGAAATAQAGFGNRVNDCIGADLPGFLQRFEALVQQKVVERQ